MEEQGRIKLVPGQKFMFIEPGGVFLHQSELPPGVTLGEGDSVSYEAEPGAKGPRVVKGTLKVTAKAAARVHGTSPAPIERAEPDRAIPQTSALRVSWGFGRMTEDNTLPVQVFLKFGMDAALDQPVQLLINGRRFKKPIHPDEEGSVVFLVPVPSSVNLLALHAEVGGRLYARVWQKEGSFLDTTSDEQQAAGEPAALPPVKPLVEELAQRNGIYTHQVTANPKTDVTTDGIAVEGRTPPCDDPDSNWGTGPYKTDEAGVLILQIRVRQDGARGDVHFCSQGLRSDPEYVVHRNPPKRQKPTNPSAVQPTT